jgi:uncharacterized protein (TIGR00299 family) protein
MSGRLAILDAQSGLAGDMWVGACLDAGAPLERLAAAIAPGRLGCRLTAERVRRAGLVGTKFTVVVDEDRKERERRLPDVLAVLQRLDLPAPVRARAASVFARLAEAEAAAHGIAPDAVHFHEVGAVDAIVDIACGCLAIHELDIAEVYCPSVEAGRGRVRCVHGVLPVPAPATSRLLRGFRQRRTRDGEHTTPTGAALLAEFVDPRRSLPEFISEVDGYGAGTREVPDLPNLLRLTLARAAAAPAAEVAEISCNLDTADGECLAALLDGCLSRGALDAYVVPLTMKKGRPGFLLCALTSRALESTIARYLLEESSSLGVRVAYHSRYCNERWQEQRDTSLGVVRFKCAKLPSGTLVARPEDDEVVRLVREFGLPRHEVLSRLQPGRANDA